MIDISDDALSISKTSCKGLIALEVLSNCAINIFDLSHVANVLSILRVTD